MDDNAKSKVDDLILREWKIIKSTKWTSLSLSLQIGQVSKADEFVHQRIWLILQDDGFNIKDNEMNKSTEETSWNYPNEKDLNSMNLSV